MDTTSFEIFFLPLFQRFALCFVTIATGRAVLVLVARVWQRVADQG